MTRTQHDRASTAPPDEASTEGLFVSTQIQQLNQAGGLLDKAADLIGAFGLFRGAYWPGAPLVPYVTGDPCCTLGSLAVAAGIYHADDADTAFSRHPGLETAIDEISAVVAERDPHFVHVWGWNDSHDRTQPEVLAVLRAAAARARTEAADLTTPSTPSAVSVAVSGGPSAKSFHQTGASSTHQHSTSEETRA